jgi:hypothetical protein
MEAARTLAERGHQVTLYEKTDKLFKLKEVNMSVTTDFDSFHKVKLKGNLFIARQRLRCGAAHIEHGRPGKAGLQFQRGLKARSDLAVG